MKMYPWLRALSPVVLVLFIFTIALPSYGDENPSIQVSSPPVVTRGDSFDLTITPVGRTLNLNDITISLPVGLSADMYPATQLPNGSFSYRILTGPYNGTFNMVITIASSTGSPISVARTVTIQPTFFDVYGPWIMLGVVVLLIGLSSSGGSGGRH